MPWRDQRKGHATRIGFTRKGSYFQCLSLASRRQSQFRIHWSTGMCAKKKENGKVKGKGMWKGKGKERDMKLVR